MHRPAWLRPSPLVLGSAFVIAAALGSTAWAAIPSADGVIHTCYKSKGGQDDDSSSFLRVRDAELGGKCTKNEKALDFNQIGPKGDQGVQGIQGIQGIQGAPGIQGLRGEQGLQGFKGDPGEPGAPGASGGVVHQASGGTQPITVSVPAGTYMVVGSARLQNSDSDGQIAFCTLQGSSVAVLSLSGQDNDVLPVFGTVVMPTAGTITLSCGGFAISTFSSRMFAIPVAGVVNG